MFEIGRICVKTAGREAGRFCTVVAKDKDKDFLIVTGPKDATKVRRRKCNYRHLEATPFRIEIKENATDEEVMKAYEKDDIFAKLRIKTPGAEQASEERKEKRAEAKEAKETKSGEKEERAEAKHEKKEEKEEKEHKPAHKEEKPKKAHTKKATPKKAKKD